MTRERDELGRPLPRGVVGVPGPTSRHDRTPAETLDEAQRWLDDGRPFAAHEVFEDAWKSCPAAERGLWQGLAQSAVALTHALRGNRTGARTVLARAQENLIPFASDPPYGLDLAALSDWSDRLDHALSTAPTGEAAQAPPIPPLRR